VANNIYNALKIRANIMMVFSTTKICEIIKIIDAKLSSGCLVYFAKNIKPIINITIHKSIGFLLSYNIITPKG